MDKLNNVIRKFQDKLYFMGRIIAILILGPILIYKSIIYNDILLLIFGILIIVWDGLSMIFFPAKYCIKH